MRHRIPKTPIEAAREWPDINVSRHYCHYLGQRQRSTFPPIE